MKKVLVVNNSMFLKNKTVTLYYEDGRVSITFKNALPIVVLGLAKRYEATQIIVNGNKKFNEKYIKELEEIKSTTYADLEVEIVNGLKGE